MAASLKTRGLRDLANIKQRVIRQHSLGRISREDRDKLVSLADRFEAAIISMEEKGSEEEPW